MPHGARKAWQPLYFASKCPHLLHIEHTPGTIQRTLMMKTFKQINCNGTHFQIGYNHGQEAKTEVQRALIFYEDFFKESAGLSWPEVCHTAERFEPTLQAEWPQYCEEIRGVASGAGVPYLSVLALNVRTEIAYGMSKDGCTALYWNNGSSAYLAQNWDWQEEQQENLINLSITQKGKPTITMVTEAGIIGKIGLNSAGVGICLNAIRALGVDFQRMPCHLALRACLESSSVSEAVARLRKTGVASACHILVADPGKAVGLECSSVDIVELPTKSTLTHTNHFIKPHDGVEDKFAFADSPIRLKRIDKLMRDRSRRLDARGTLKAEDIRSLLQDQDNFPTAICRSRTEESTIATLFNIVMDLRKREAQVVVGKPSQEGADIMKINPINC